MQVLKGCANSKQGFETTQTLVHCPVQTKQAERSDAQCFILR